MRMIHEELLAWGITLTFMGVSCVVLGGVGMFTDYIKDVPAWAMAILTINGMLVTISGVKDIHDSIDWGDEDEN